MHALLFELVNSMLAVVVSQGVWFLVAAKISTKIHPQQRMPEATELLRTCW